MTDTMKWCRFGGHCCPQKKCNNSNFAWVTLLSPALSHPIFNQYEPHFFSDWRLCAYTNYPLPPGHGVLTSYGKTRKLTRRFEFYNWSSEIRRILALGKYFDKLSIVFFNSRVTLIYHLVFAYCFYTS